MIQDITPHVFSNTYQIKQPDANSIVLHYVDNEVLMNHRDGNAYFPTLGELASFLALPKLRYAFSINEQAYFLVTDTTSQLIEKSDESQVNTQEEKHTQNKKQANTQDGNQTTEMPGNQYLQYEPLYNMRTLRPMWLAFAGITGSQLARFYQRNVYCGVCATKMEHSHTERAMQCPNCQTIVYPTISPAVIVAVSNGDKLCMTRYANRPYQNYALIAGFVEFGETLEQCVAREVMEEVGLKVKNIRYYKSQPWSFSDSLLAGFYCEVDGSDELTVDTNELSEASWIAREDMPPRELDISLTGEMMEMFRLQKHLD